MSDPEIPKCDITGKHPTNPGAKCDATPAPAGSPAPTNTGMDPKQDVLFTIPGCGHCAEARATPGVKTGFGTKELREVSYGSPEGEVLAKQYNLESGPKILHQGEVCKVSTQGQALCEKAGVIEYGKKAQKNELPHV